MSFKSTLLSLFSILTLLCVFSGCVGNQSLTPKLSGSQTADNIRPLAVSLLSDFGPKDVPETFCSGTWVSQSRILTAAHCVAGWAMMKHRQMVVEALLAAGYPDFIARLIASLDPSELDADDPGMPPMLKGALDIIAKIPPIHEMGLEIKYLVPGEVVDVGVMPLAIHSSTTIFWDKRSDLAILAVDGLIPAHGIAVLADKAPVVGSGIHSMGTPDRLFFTYRQGYVSAYRHSLVKAGMPNIDGPFMQVATGMSPGDSGSGAFDDGGKLVGVASFIDPESGMGFCIHVETIRRLLIGQQLIKAKLDVGATDPDLTDAPLH